MLFFLSKYLAQSSYTVKQTTLYVYICKYANILTKYLVKKACLNMYVTEVKQPNLICKYHTKILQVKNWQIRKRTHQRAGDELEETNKSKKVFSWNVGYWQEWNTDTNTYSKYRYKYRHRYKYKYKNRDKYNCNLTCGCNEVEKGSTGGVEQGPEREKEEEEAASLTKKFSQEIVNLPV